MKRPQWNAVFFDFDGVIADSVAVKTNAFATMFAPYGAQVVDKVVSYHLDHGGMPRYQKIRYFHEELLGKSIDDQSLNEAGQKFSDLVLQGVIAADFIPGALESLRILQQHKIPAFVVSGTPHEEMQVVVKEKKISHFFQEVHGSPRTKTEIVLELLQKYTLDPGHCLFIGDAMADLTAAQNTGLHFLGISRPGTTITFPAETTQSSHVCLTLPE